MIDLNKEDIEHFLSSQNRWKHFNNSIPIVEKGTKEGSKSREMCGESPCKYSSRNEGMLTREQGSWCVQLAAGQSRQRTAVAADLSRQSGHYTKQQLRVSSVTEGRTEDGTIVSPVLQSSV